ncbi:outer membrane beta-barrel protein [Saccharicrinis aurantiacus]|uniref:outer membrane beta-barrel protein n=1 Tax=Saccharicrinis aurantiacus TaxID=1849719 RepID=UPI00249384A6|nr:outer membrane beta-barrel protein [Saccharicrinis aurantiacus]
MKKLILSLAIVFAFGFAAKAQDEKPGLEITGSVDTYFKYDFSGQSNIPTSFADDHNSVSLGMIDIALSQSVGKASFVGEISFGPRSFKSIPVFEDPSGETHDINIQNLYTTYEFSDKFSATAGYMGTFVGYEVISPAANFNYSTSYLFSAGPFQNAGLKLDYAISDKFGVMVGMFNDWNVYQDLEGVSDFGAQVYVSPVDGWDAYVNFVTGPNSGTIIDLTTGWQITDAFYLGLNAADYSYKESDLGGYSGVAFYPQYAFSEKVSLGYRGEFFSIKEDKISETESSSIFSNTLTLNYYHGPLTFVTEFRLDSAKDEIFMDADDMATKGATQFLLAAIYAF